MSHERPARLHKIDEETLGIDWSDGVLARYPVRVLRLRCPCATCVDEITGQPRLVPDSVPEDVRPVSIQPVGKYALHIQWSDGHTTGIYSFELLREIFFDLSSRSGDDRGLIRD